MRSPKSTCSIRTAERAPLASRVGHLPSAEELSRATDLVAHLERATDAEFDAHPAAETASVRTWSSDFPRLNDCTMVQAAVVGWLFVARQFGSVRHSLDELLAAERGKYPLAFEGGDA